VGERVILAEIRRTHSKLKLVESDYGQSGNDG
jgi:hypothetical protein